MYKVCVLSVSVLYELQLFCMYVPILYMYIYLCIYIRMF